MNIEIRSKKRESIGSNGMVDRMCMDLPLVKITTAHECGDALAVCLNGKWFFEAITPMQTLLEDKWNDANERK